METCLKHLRQPNSSTFYLKMADDDVTPINEAQTKDVLDHLDHAIGFLECKFSSCSATSVTKKHRAGNLKKHQVNHAHRKSATNSREGSLPSGHGTVAVDIVRPVGSTPKDVHGQQEVPNLAEPEESRFVEVLENRVLCPNGSTNEIKKCDESEQIKRTNGSICDSDRENVVEDALPIQESATDVQSYTKKTWHASLGGMAASNSGVSQRQMSEEQHEAIYAEELDMFRKENSHARMDLREGLQVTGEKNGRRNTQEINKDTDAPYDREEPGEGGSIRKQQVLVGQPEEDASHICDERKEKQQIVSWSSEDAQSGLYGAIDYESAYKEQRADCKGSFGISDEKVQCPSPNQKSFDCNGSASRAKNNTSEIPPLSERDCRDLLEANPELHTLVKKAYEECARELVEEGRIFSATTNEELHFSHQK